jgi:hypothetical protein
VRIHFAAEHASQLEVAHLTFKTHGVRLDIARGRCVRFTLRHREDFARVGDVFRQPVEFVNLSREARALAAQFLGALGLRPQLWVFQLAPDLLEAFLLFVVFKETPVRSRCAPRGRAVVV